MPYHKLISDHRGIWIDIPKYLIYGYNPPSPTFPFAQRLKMNNPCVVQKYLTTLYQELDKDDLFHRMSQIHAYACHHLDNNLTSEYEDIYKSSLNAMTLAEKQCRKLRTGAHSWSPTYKKACLALEYWLNRKSHFLGKHRNVRQLIVLQNKLHLTYDSALSLQDIEKKIVLAYKHR